MKTKTLSLISIAVILMAAIAVGYLISKPALFVQKKSPPVFAGEEVTVQKADKAVAAIKGKMAVRVEKAVKVAKVENIPAPQPKVAVPLPILPPKISYRVLPNYPVTALEKGLEGTTLLSIYVGLNGNPEKIKIKSSAGVAEFDKAAAAAVSRWKFEPASQGGKAIDSWLEMPVRFVLR